MFKVQSIVRLRPASFGASSAKITIDGNVISFADNFGKQIYSTEMDSIFDVTTTQTQIFNDFIIPLVDLFLQGVNVNILTYGQTSPGKTYTMFGNPNDLGIVPRSIARIFELLGRDTNITCTCLEIYGDECRDLLSNKEHLKVRESKHGLVFVENLVETEFLNSNDLLQSLNIAVKNRTSSTTKMNSVSSRAHMLIFLKAYSVSRPKQFHQISFVDLAGSERISKTEVNGKSLQEAKAINKSLSALANCIFALASTKPVHVPYRDSKLTFLLKNVLESSSKTVIIAACSSDHFNNAESVSTLRFSSTARSICMRATKKPLEKSSTSTMVQLRDTINELKFELFQNRKIICNLQERISSFSNNGVELQDFLIKSQEPVQQLEIELSDKICLPMEPDLISLTPHLLYLNDFDWFLLTPKNVEESINIVCNSSLKIITQVEGKIEVGTQIEMLREPRSFICQGTNLSPRSLLNVLPVIETNDGANKLTSDLINRNYSEDVDFDKSAIHVPVIISSLPYFYNEINNLSILSPVSNFQGKNPNSDAGISWLDKFDLGTTGSLVSGADKINSFDDFENNTPVCFDNQIYRWDNGFNDVESLAVSSCSQYLHPVQPLLEKSCLFDSVNLVTVSSASEFQSPYIFCSPEKITEFDEKNVHCSLLLATSSDHDELLNCSKDNNLTSAYSLFTDCNYKIKENVFIPSPIVTSNISDESGKFIQEMPFISNENFSELREEKGSILISTDNTYLNIDTKDVKIFEGMLRHKHFFGNSNTIWVSFILSEHANKLCFYKSEKHAKYNFEVPFEFYFMCSPMAVSISKSRETNCFSVSEVESCLNISFFNSNNDHIEFEFGIVSENDFSKWNEVVNCIKV